MSIQTLKKNILAFALCAVLCFCMALPTFAAGTPEAAYTGETKSEDVKVTISGDLVHVYLVDIEFTNPTFTYSSGSKWNPETYQYAPSTAAPWTGTGTVKITNHSDLEVKYNVDKANVVGTYGPLDIEVTGGNGTIAKCNVGDARGSHNATATFTVTGTPTVAEITAQKLGEITVKIER